MLSSSLLALSTLLAVMTVTSCSSGHAVSGAKPLFCMYGGVEVVPDPLPPGYETQFAIAVVEIDSQHEASGLAVTDLELLDKDGAATKLKRVVEVEVFERPRVATEGEFAYYLNPGSTRPWNGTLPVGKIEIRVRVALERAPVAPVRFRLVLGPHMIEGRVDGSWPT